MDRPCVDIVSGFHQNTALLMFETFPTMHNVEVQSHCTICFLSESDYDSSRFACRDSFRNLCLNCSILCLNCCITHA